jgi:hypothetical protein
LVSRINETRPDIMTPPATDLSGISEALSQLLSRKDPYSMVEDLGNRPPSPVFDPEALVSRINETRPDIMTPPAADLSGITEALSQLLSRKDPYSMVEDLARSANPYATRTQPNTEPYRSTAPQYSDPDLTRSANPYATPVGLDALMNDYVRNSTRRLSATPSRGF